jgi:hypothetical protein
MDFLQTKITDYFIESHNILHITPFLISVLKRAIDVKISYKHPIDFIIYLQAVEPINKFLPLLSLTGPIDCGKLPFLCIVYCCEFDCESKS